MNQHIIKQLNFYLKEIENTDYAVLISGKWGCGKTHFINRYIEEFKSEKKYHFIRISLFGLRRTEDIDEKIFQSLHPILSSKYMQIAGGILKSASKIGFNIDINSDGKADSTASVDTKELKFLDLFTTKDKKDKELIFVFDDLERTQIKLAEALGYINNIVEVQSLKAIILASEDNINPTEQKIYTEFKEKVIGATLEIQQDINGILEQFLSHSKASKSQDCIIKDIYIQSKHNNLRHLKRTIIFYDFFTSKINTKFLKNNEFLQQLTKIFFALSIEIKHGTIEKENLQNYATLSIDPNKTDSVSIALKKYALPSDMILPPEIWADIFYKNIVDDKKINTLIANLNFFMEPNGNSRPSWVKLWHYTELKEDEFNESLRDVLIKYKNFEYTTPEILFHVISILIMLSKAGVHKETSEEIIDQLRKDTSRHTSSVEWKTRIISAGYNFNGTGLGYINYDDPDFTEARNILLRANKILFDNSHEAIKVAEKNGLANATKNGDTEFFNNIREKYFMNSFFHDVDAENFINQIALTPNEKLSTILHFLNTRYAENNKINGVPLSYYYKDEINFWRNSIKFLMEKEISGIKKITTSHIADKINRIIKNIESSN